MPTEREVHYTESGGLQVAYEVVGDGPLDIVTAFEHGSNIDLMHEHPRIDRFLRRLGEFGRLILVDLRGVGLSDAMEQVPPLEDWVDDVRAVMSTVRSERAALIGHGYGAQSLMLFAAMHPELTSALVTINGYARLRRAPDYAWGYPPHGEAALLAFMAAEWGSGSVLGSFNPGMAQAPRDWLARLERASATPRRAVLRQRLAFDIDVRDVLPTIAVPTLVIQSEGDPYIRRGHAQYLLEHIDGARHVELAGADHTPAASDESEPLMEVIEEFLTGSTHRSTTDRVLKTVAFTDIVGSTEMAVDLGDRRWRSLLESHESVSRREIDRAQGRLVKFTGDGSMATFDGPARAVQCMRSIEETLGSLGLRIRAGVHTGEVELMNDDIGGIAVHVAARIAALAGAGEILTSSTVRDLVAGSGLEFEDRGEQSLKGVPEPWRVFAAT